jgi:DNA-binding LytR/AlgR family response regulator
MQMFFFIKNKGEYVKVNFHELVYVEARKNYMKLMTESKSFLVLITMKELEDILPRDQFCRVHKSYIVSLERIISFDSDYVVIKNLSLPLGLNYKKKLMNRISILGKMAVEKKVKKRLEAA